MILTAWQPILCYFMLKAWNRQYLAETITDTDYADDITLLANTLAQGKSLLHSQEQAAEGINLHVNANIIKYMCFKWEGAISTLNEGLLKFPYLGSSISSTERDVNILLAKVWTPVNRLLIIWKSDLSDKIKWDFFQAVAVSVLLYRYTIWMLTKHIKKRLDGNYTRMLRAILKKSWRRHPHKAAAVLPLTSHL